MGRTYKGTQGLCMARWELWRERFGAVVRDSNKVDDSPRMVGRACSRCYSITGEVRASSDQLALGTVSE